MSHYTWNKRLTIIASLSASMTLDSIVLSNASTKSCIPPPASAKRRTNPLSAPEPIPKACTRASLAWFFTRVTVPSVLLMAPSVSTNICNYKQLLVAQRRLYCILQQCTAIGKKSLFSSPTITYISINFFIKRIGGHQSFLWSHWYPCLMAFVLAFKARVDPLLACFLTCMQ